MRKRFLLPVLALCLLPSTTASARNNQAPIDTTKCECTTCLIEAGRCVTSTKADDPRQPQTPKPPKKGSNRPQ